MLEHEDIVLFEGGPAAMDGSSPGWEGREGRCLDSQQEADAFAYAGSAKW